MNKKPDMPFIKRVGLLIKVFFRRISNIVMKNQDKKVYLLLPVFLKLIPRYFLLWVLRIKIVGQLIKIEFIEIISFFKTAKDNPEQQETYMIYIIFFYLSNVLILDERFSIPLHYYVIFTLIIASLNIKIKISISFPNYLISLFFTILRILIFFIAVYLFSTVNILALIKIIFLYVYC